ncbi:MAG TPA: hypothetical protein PK636_04580 [bacterium]|nr:hypothetical protein [bacterium]
MDNAAGMVFGQDHAPVGPGGWTARNWLGFFLQIGLFLLGAVLVFWVSGAFSRDRAEGEGREE